MKNFLFSWTKFIANELSSATVEDTAKANIVLTFKDIESVKPFTGVAKTCFTTAGKVVDSIAIDKAAKTLTVTVTVAYVAGAAFNLVFNPTKKGVTQTISITNNVA